LEKLSKKTLSLPVLSVNEGEHLGYVKSLVVDPVLKEVIAFVINQKGWFKEDKVIPFNRVKNIGDSAIVIDKSGTVEKPANFPQIIKLMKNPARLINTKVVSTSGKTLGHVEEFYFNITGKITKFELNGKFTDGFWKGKTLLPCAEVITIGKDVIIVNEGAEDRLINEGKDLKKTINDLKSVTSKAWDATVQTSQKLGQAITNSINKLAEEEKELKASPPEPAAPENPAQEPDKNHEETPPPETPETGQEETCPASEPEKHDQSAASEPKQHDQSADISEETEKTKK